MPKASLKRAAILEMLRTSAIFSVLLLFITSLTSGFFYKISKDNEKRSLISKQLNSIENFIRQKNYPILAQNIQQDLALQELVITDPNCNILATTSLTFNSKECRVSNHRLGLFNTKIGEKELLIFYEDGFSYLSAIKEHLIPLTVLASCFFLITFLCLWYFLFKTFTSPLNKMKTAISKGDDSDLIKEFDFIGHKLMELKSEIEKKESEKAYFQLAQRVVHDIRNPLAVLKSNIKNNDTFALKKIDEIEYQIQSLLSTKGLSISFLNFEMLKKDIHSDLQVFHPMKLDFFYESNAMSVGLHLSYFDIKNILLNLARNSFEAGSFNLIIDIQTTKEEFKIVVTDDGPGIDPSSTIKIFEENFTTKKSGFGIGLASLKGLIENSDGKIFLNSNFKTGAQFIITLPRLSIVKDSLVLIDDDKYIHQAWINHAKERNIQVHSFKSIGDFIKVSTNFLKNIPIFVDSSLGDIESGEKGSKDISDDWFKEIYLSTGFTNPEITDFPWIKATLGKHPPF